MKRAEKRDKLELVEWENRPHCLYLNDFRIAGGKPWGGGKTIRTWCVKRSDIMTALTATERDK